MAYMSDEQKREALRIKCYEQTLRYNNLIFASKAEKEKIRLDKQLRASYGITIEEYNEIFKAQGERCAICSKHQSELKTKLYVDHCHVSGRVRGLLCPSCNMGVGVVENQDIDKIREYIEYFNLKHEVEEQDEERKARWGRDEVITGDL